MSLINDVLRDLERRRDDEAGGAQTVRSAPPPRKHPVRAWMLLTVGAVVAGVALHFSLGQDSTANVEPAEGRLTAMIGETTSSVETAFEAKDSLQRPASTANTAGSQSLDADEPSDDSSSVTPSVQDDPVKLAEAPPAAPAPQPTPGTDDIHSESSAPIESDALAQGSPSISIQRSGDAGANDDPLRDARRMLARGQSARAQSKLDGLLKSEPGNVPARELMARIHLQTGRPVAAERVLRDGLAQVAHPAPLAALLGRLYIEQGRAADAVSVLAGHHADSFGDPEYALLLGAAYRQAGEHEAAAGVYESLGQRQPTLGAAWIGLGASLEALVRPKEATDAYRTALDSNDIRARRFARERLEALEPLTGDAP